MSNSALESQSTSSEWSNESFYSNNLSFISDIPTQSWITSHHQSSEQNALDLTLESHMNAAGRSSTHPFGDLRSASRARHRTRNSANDRKWSAGKCHSVGCRKWSQSARRLENKRQKREIVRVEVQCSQLWGIWDLGMRGDFDYADDLRNDLDRYIKFRKNAEVFESEEEYTEVGELFSTWAQRRIAEMRAVKEDRLRASKPVVQPVEVARTERVHPWYAHEYEVYCGSPQSTTLPTNTYDAHGHVLLRIALTPSKCLRRRARFDPRVHPFPVVNGFSWFGEYAWQWHRDAASNWMIGYWQECSPIGGGTYPRCWCRQFADEPAPDEAQRCSLVEWVSKEGMALIEREELESKIRGQRWDEQDDCASVCGSDWSVVEDGSEASPSSSSIMSWVSLSSFQTDIVVER